MPVLFEQARTITGGPQSILAPAFVPVPRQRIIRVARVVDDVPIATVLADLWAIVHTLTPSYLSSTFGLVVHVSDIAESLALIPPHLHLSLFLFGPKVHIGQRSQRPMQVQSLRRVADSIPHQLIDTHRRLPVVGIGADGAPLGIVVVRAEHA